MSKGERGLLAAGFAIGLAGLLVALAAIALSLVDHHRDHQQIQTLEQQVQALCARQVVTGVKLNTQGHATVSTAKGC